LYALKEKPKGYKCEANTKFLSKKKGSCTQGFGLEDNRLETAIQLKLIENANIVQRYHIQDKTEGVFLAQEERNTETGKTFMSKDQGKANISVNHASTLRVADTGKMAIEAGGSSREAKIFYGTKEIQTESNKILKGIGSPIRLGINTSLAIPVFSNEGVRNILYAIYPIDVIDKKLGHEVEVPERCNEAGPHILNTCSDKWIKTKFDKDGWGNNLMDKGIDESIIRVLNHFKLNAEKGELENEYATYWKTNWFRTMINPLAKQFISTRHDNENNLLADYDNRIQDPGMDDTYDLFQRFSNNPKDFIVAYAEMLNTPEGMEIIKKAGINDVIDPEVGEMLSIRSVSAEEDKRNFGDDMFVMDQITKREIKNPFPYHFASVIAKSGSDYITMENYARRESDQISSNDPRFFFQMYGPKSQSFHEESKADYPAAMTLVLGRQPERNNAPEYDIDSPQFEQMQKFYNSKLNQFKT